MADIVPIGGGARQPPPGEPDAHGQAALMLAESTLHALVDLGTISIEDALGIVATAQEVKVEIGKELHESSANIVESIQLLDRIATSFAADLRD